MTNEEKDKLERNVAFHGFSARTVAEVMMYVDGNEKKFSVPEKGKIDSIDYRATLNFNRSEKNGQVYFNDFILTLPARDGRKPFSQSFPIKYRADFTLREAFNLMNGRYVSKEMLDGEEKLSKPWVRMAFSMVNDDLNHPIVAVSAADGFNLMKELEKFPIANFNANSNGAEAVKALERGNRHPAVLELNGTSELFSFTANPETGGLDVYDKAGVKLSPEDVHLIEKAADRSGKVLTANDLEEGRSKGEDKTKGEGTDMASTKTEPKGDGDDPKKKPHKHR